MEGDADSFVACFVVVPFSWRGAIHEAGEFLSSDAEVGESSEAETKHGSSEDENCLLVSSSDQCGMGMSYTV